MRLLLVEDDAALAEALQFSLRADGYVVDRVGSGLDAEHLLQSETFDLVVLDLNLPGLDGIEVLRRMRTRRDPAPVLVASASDHDDQLVTALDIGADDYLVKPFGLRELSARVRALLRRSGSARTSLIAHASLAFNTATRTASVAGTTIDLSPREISLLEALLLSFGDVVRKDRLLSQVYGFGEDVGVNAIEVYIHRLRKKIGGSGVGLRTVHGRGYLLELESSESMALALLSHRE